MSSLLSILEWCSKWGPIIFIRDSKYGMPSIQSAHLLGLTLLLATVFLLDLRLAGFGMMDLPLSGLARQLKPWTVGALTMMLLSGIFIFLATPGKYLGSNPFRAKMVFLCLAILFHFGVLRRFTASDHSSRPRLVNAMIAVISLTLWFSVGWAGRAIAFVP